MVQPMFTMNQLEVVPLYVVPSEKVLDLSYQPGIGYPRTPTQGYPYPRAGTPPPPPQCFGWKQSFRQPTWPNPAQPYDRVPITPYHEVPKDDNERRNEKDKGREQKHQTPEQESEDKQHELSVERYNLSEDIGEDSDKIDMANYMKEAGQKVSMHRETNLERLKEGVSGVKINYEESHKLNVYRPFQDSDKVVEAKKDVHSHKEEFSVYGEHVGNQLRSLTDRHSLTVARYEIDRVIFKAIMGEYYVGSCQCCLQDPSKDSYRPRSSTRSPQASNSPAFQPYRTSVQTPIQPLPIRPQLSVEPWTGVK